MALNVPGALEAGQDESVLQAADDVLDGLGLAAVLVPAADEGMEDLDEIEHVLADFSPGV
jgi:hypothetical protein